MNRRALSQQFRVARLALVATLMLLGGCTTYSTPYYPDDAGYGYYDPGHAEPWYGAPASSVSIHLGSYYGYRDPWVYPYASLDLFYFGPYAYNPWYSAHAAWAFIPWRYRYPYGYGYGYGYGSRGFGHVWYGWGFPRYSSHGGYYGGYHGGHRHPRYGHTDNRNQQPRTVDARVRALSYEPPATPTRRSLISGRSRPAASARVTETATRAQLISNRSSRAALRGELNRDAANRAAPAASFSDRARLLAPTNANRKDATQAARSVDSRRIISSGNSRTAPQSLAPATRAVQTRAVSSPAASQRSRVREQAATGRAIPRTIAPASRAAPASAAPQAGRPGNRVREAAPAARRPATRLTSPRATSSPAPTARAPAAVRPTAPAPVRAPAPAVRPAAPASKPDTMDRRREALSGRRDNGRRDNGRRR